MVKQRRSVVEDHDIDGIRAQPRHESGGECGAIPEQAPLAALLVDVDRDVDVAVSLSPATGGGTEEVRLQHLGPRFEKLPKAGDERFAVSFYRIHRLEHIG